MYLAKILLRETDDQHSLNKPISHVVEKNQFLLVASGADEDWGYGQPTPANKWVWLL
jgi:hypothetical protein